MTHAGDLATLARVARRHAATFPQVHAAGEPRRTVLPVPLRAPAIGCDFGRMEENITLRIPIGPRPRSGRALLRLGFSADVPADIASDLQVRLSTRAVAPCEPPRLTSAIGRLGPRKTGWNTHLPERAAMALCWELPLSLLNDDVNVIEFVPPQIDGTLEWAEIVVLP